VVGKIKDNIIVGVILQLMVEELYTVLYLQTGFY